MLGIVERLQKLHSKLGGRTEIRIQNGVMYFDVAVHETRRNFASYFEALRELGVRQLAQHRGKHNRVRNEFERAGITLVEV